MLLAPQPLAAMVLAKAAGTEVVAWVKRIHDLEASIDPAHVTQMLALARTLAKRDEQPWPRRIERWRAPGVR